jgi:hypothetical protein
MTYDELLVKLMVMDADESEQTRLSKTTQAIRAVVELHKMCCDLEELCNECNPNVPYPCSTIQAIKKELE